MKNFLKIILLFFTGFISGQELPILSTTSLNNPNDEWNHWENGNYAMDTANERQEYIGLWRYNDEEILFELKIELKNQNLKKMEINGITEKYDYVDIIVPKYRLIKNGIVLFDNIGSTVDNINTLINYGYKEANYNLRGRIYDYHRQVVGSYEITKIPGSPEKIFFNLREFNYSIKGDPSMYQPGIKLFSIPTAGIEMVKVD